MKFESSIMEPLSFLHVNATLNIVNLSNVEYKPKHISSGASQWIIDLAWITEPELKILKGPTKPLWVQDEHLNSKIDDCSLAGDFQGQHLYNLHVPKSQSSALCLNLISLI